MKYLDTLAKLRKAGQGTEAGHAELQKTANLKVTYIKAKGEFRNLKEQAFDHIKASEDPGSMRALYQVLMHNISWEAIPSMLLSSKLNDAPSGRLFRADLEFLQRCSSL